MRAIVAAVLATIIVTAFTVFSIMFSPTGSTGIANEHPTISKLNNSCTDCDALASFNDLVSYVMETE